MAIPSCLSKPSSIPRALPERAIRPQSSSTWGRPGGIGETPDGITTTERSSASSFVLCYGPPFIF